MSRSKELFASAQALFPGGSTRATLVRQPFPIYVARGEGCHLIDVDGRAYVDLDNNFTALVHGHANPAIVETLVEQAQLGTCFGAPTQSELLLASMLQQRNI